MRMITLQSRLIQRNCLQGSGRIADRIITPLEQNDLRQKQFVSDAGHELKTPLSVISTNAELLQRQSGDSEWLSNIRYETDRMSTLVKQLLSSSIQVRLATASRAIRMLRPPMLPRAISMLPAATEESKVPFLTAHTQVMLRAVL